MSSCHIRKDATEATLGKVFGAGLDGPRSEGAREEQTITRRVAFGGEREGAGRACTEPSHLRTPPMIQHV